MRLRWWAVGVAAVLALSACSSGGATAGVGDGQGFVSGDGTVVVVAPSDRVDAPDLSGETLDGEPLALADYAGDVVVLNVWGSWCAPCRAEAPALEAVYEEAQPDGVSFLGINTRDDLAAAQAFVRRFSVSYPSLVDTDGRLLLQFGTTLPPSAIPSTLVVDREGRIAARVLGPTTFTELRRLVNQVAAEQP